MPIATSLPFRHDPTPNRWALPLMPAVGSLLAISVLLSKIAAGLPAPMLTYLALAMGGSGLILTIMNGGVRRDYRSFAKLAAYSLVAGALMSLGSALGYLTVHKVGAAFVALALAFPPDAYLALVPGFSHGAV